MEEARPDPHLTGARLRELGLLDDGDAQGD